MQPDIAPPVSPDIMPETGSHRADRWIGVAGALAFIGAGIALWAFNGASVFASAMSGLWALCF